MAPLVSSLRLQEAEFKLRNHSKTTDEESEDEYNQYNGIPVASGVTIKRARAFLEKKHGMSFRYINKELFAIDFNGPIHARGRMEIIRPFARDLSLFFGSVENFELQGDILVADGAITPKKSVNPNRPPTVIAEFASSESLQSVYRIATRYLDPATHVQIVICCKIWGQRVNGSKAMLFMLFERNNMVVGGYVTPTRVVSFGTIPLDISVSTQLQNWGVPRATLTGYLHPSVGNGPPCTENGHPDYVINIPATPVYHLSAIPIPATISMNGFDIDLYNVQELCS